MQQPHKVDKQDKEHSVFIWVSPSSNACVCLTYYKTFVLLSGSCYFAQFSCYALKFKRIAIIFAFFLTEDLLECWPFLGSLETLALMTLAAFQTVIYREELQVLHIHVFLQKRDMLLCATKTINARNFSMSHQTNPLFT